jgi:hypothetical protein
MRFIPPALRRLARIASVVLLWLLAASVCEAAPHQTARRAKTRRVCDPHTTTQKLPRKPVSYGGPVVPPSARQLAGLSDPMAHLRRGARVNFGKYEQAIQNDSSFVALAPTLTPHLDIVFLLDEPLASPLVTRPLSPRSPRGPPASV